MKRILQIGAGGIGSYLAMFVNERYLQGVQGTEDIVYTLVDNDEVEEKNLRYQNFKPTDLGKKKATIIGERYLFQFKNKFIETDEDLKGFDIIVLCVDNGKARNLVYEFCDKNKNVKFIDLRSEGQSCCFFTTNKENTLEFMKSTIDVSKPSTSCQLKFELEQGKIQQGNIIIASIGSQLLLNELRGEYNMAKFIQRF